MEDPGDGAPAKRCQLQLVSREWKRELTSAAFRWLVAARERERAAAGTGTSAMIACVAQRWDTFRVVRIRAGVPWDTTSWGYYHCRSAVAAGVDVDLTRLVPASFSDRRNNDLDYTVLAAGDGLVCLAAADTYIRGGPLSLCVVNPLSRASRELPELPDSIRSRLLWPGQHRQRAVHLRAGRVTVLVNVWDLPEDEVHWVVATYDLTAAPAAQQQWTVAQGPACPDLAYFAEGLCSQHLVWCDGKVWCYLATRFCVQVDAVTPDGGVAAVATSPTPTFLTNVCMAERGGSVYVIATARDCLDHISRHIWRLEICPGRGTNRVVWRWVTKLPRHVVNRLTGYRYVRCREVWVRQVCPAGDMICFQIDLKDWRKCRRGAPRRSLPANVMLGFNLVKEDWELVFDETGLGFDNPFVFDLRPDEFLV